MTEVVDDSDAGKRRRLPIWMARASYSDEIRNYGAGDGLQDAGSEPRSTARMQKRKPAQAVDHLDEFEATRRTVARQRKRKASRRNVGQDSSLSSNGIGETKTTTEETEEGETIVDNAANSVKVESRKSIKRSKNSVVPCSPASSESEIELTVEDLVRIAEENVNADRQKQHGRSTAKEPRSEPCSSDSSVVIGGAGPRQTACPRQALSRCTKTSGPNFPEATPRTGDAAQDMLDLLLGPLLKKPTSEEHENRTVATETMNLTHKPSEPSTTSKEIWKEEVLLTKRKSSLKDKVAMLLD
ncbi:hypothetical protein C4D60_Mb08t13170 [Musa balbisiana]|uniref:Uncharacterized protein n=1 Tax=Musa balbisiana TaxID=52838 RepID=A0A4S8K3J3_MUSBA|nr:hypothetical protein C4D60_Mb08t13170 [Musa balbisiana]